MKRYEKYKHSGVDWIGEIPEGWEVRKLKFLGNIYAGINGKKGDDFSKEYSEGIKSFIPFTNICNNVKIDEKHYQFVKIDENENQNRVLKNDILFLMSSETLDDIAKNSIYLGNDEELYLNSFCKGFRINDFNVFPEFINYLFLSTSYRNYFSLVGRGFTRINLKQEFINDALTLLPPLPEQTAIAAFLDDKTAKIDQTIAIRQKEIELLKERRQILIQKAVTKGLDDTVKLKPSGVDWIGEIPEHWACIKLKFLGKAIIGLTYSPNDLCDSTEGTLVLRSSNLLEGRFVYGEKENVYLRTKIPPKLMLEEDDILICSRNGSRDLIGKCAIAKPEDLGNSFGAFTTVFRSKFNKYLFCILNSNIFKNLSGSFLTSTINQLTIGNLYSIQVPIPSENEMNEIRIYINSIEAKISKAISIKEQEIEKLKEYKTVLIDNVVTGKIRVCCL